jgi:hypothetical protein
LDVKVEGFNQQLTRGKRHEPFGLALDKRYAFRMGALRDLPPLEKAEQALYESEHWHVVTMP